MRKLLYLGSLFLALACGSGEKTDNSADSSNVTRGPGNSGGSNIIGRDTMRMDTSMRKPSDSAK